MHSVFIHLYPCVYLILRFIDLSIPTSLINLLITIKNICQKVLDLDYILKKTLIQNAKTIKYIPFWIIGFPEKLELCKFLSDSLEWGVISIFHYFHTDYFPHNVLAAVLSKLQQWHLDPRKLQRKFKLKILFNLSCSNVHFPLPMSHGSLA